MNPIAQLFALCVEDLPGCKAPGGRVWAAPAGSKAPVADAADREYAAAEYLFREALNACDKAAQRRLAAKFFGGSVQAAHAVPTTPSTGRRKIETAPPPKLEGPKLKIQTNLNDFSVQAFLLKSMEKDTKATKAKAATATATSPTRPSTPPTPTTVVAEAKPKRGRKKSPTGATKIVIEI